MDGEGRAVMVTSEGFSANTTKETITEKGWREVIPSNEHLLLSTFSVKMALTKHLIYIEEDCNSDKMYMYRVYTLYIYILSELQSSSM